MYVIQSLKGLISIFKNNFRNIIIIFLLVIPFLIGLFTRPESWLSFLSDSYFYIAGPFLIVSLFGAVLKDGTFDFFHRTWKRFGQRLFKPQQIKKDDSDDLHQLSRSVGTWYKTGLKLGSSFLILSLIFLTLFYII